MSLSERLKEKKGFRILFVLPGKYDAPLCGKLRDVRILEPSSTTEYEAVSYTWATEDGDASLLSTIQCDRKVIHITKNCEAALRRFREKEKPRALWIDAICIDQNNIDERGHQVQMMRDVYGNATQVLVWLGEASNELDGETSKPASDVFLERLCAVFDAPQQTEEKRDAFVQEVGQGFLGETQSTLLSGIFDIVGRRWWSRIWVIQEVALAKFSNLYCGTRTIDYAYFLDFFYLLFARFSENISSLRIKGFLCHSIVLFGGKNSPGSDDISVFTNVMSAVRSLEASNSLDYIFGVRGLPSLKFCNLPMSDYNLSALELFTEVFQISQRGSKDLSLLYQAPRKIALQGWPTWVPDWSTACSSDSTDRPARFCNAAADTETRFQFVGDKEFRVQGWRVDEIAFTNFVAEGAYGTEFFRPGTAAAIGWLASCDIASIWMNQNQQSDAFETVWRTMCWNIDQTGDGPVPIEGLEGFRSWYNLVLSLKSKEDIVRRLGNVFKLSNDSIRREPLCITAASRLASVVHTTQPGDQIAILTGGAMPFILRQVGDKYTLVGPCYIHELMNGEEFAEHLDELEWFSII